MHLGRLATGTAGSFTVICYSRKGDNHKPKKKTQDDSRKEEAAPKAQPQRSRTPPRIVDTSTRSLKSQLRIVKTWQQQASSNGAAPASPTKFRRKRKPERQEDPEKEVDEAEKARREKMLLMRGKGLTSLYQQKDKTNNPAAMLVDGYNVMFKWMDHAHQKALKRKLAGDLQAQREAFLMELSAYTGWNRLRMMVAFDAQANPDAPAVSRDEVGGLEVVFIGIGEADSFIVREAQSLRSAGCPYVLVATSDNDIRDSCWTNEIFPVSATQLLNEINKAKKEFDRHQKEKRIRAGSRLGSAILQTNPTVYNELEKKRLPGL